MTLSKKEREELRMMFGGRCAYCGCDLLKGWHADHVKPVLRETYYKHNYETGHGSYVASGEILRKENDTKDNLFPACRACNIDKSSIPLEEWRSWLQDRMVENLRQYIANFRHAERFGRVTVVSAPLVFWFEKYRSQQEDQ